MADARGGGARIPNLVIQRQPSIARNEKEKRDRGIDLCQNRKKYLQLYLKFHFIYQYNNFCYDIAPTFLRKKSGSDSTFFDCDFGMVFC